LRDILVRLQRVGGVALLGLGKILVVPGADGGVERGAGARGVVEALSGGGVGADEGGEVDGREAF